MYLSPTFISAAAVAVALSFTVVQAEPQQNGMSTGNPPAAGNSASSPVGRPDQPSAATGGSDHMSPGSGKGKTAEGAMPPEGQSGKGVKAGNDTGMPTGQDNNAAVKGDKEKGKTAEGALIPCAFEADA